MKRLFTALMIAIAGACTAAPVCEPASFKDVHVGNTFADSGDFLGGWVYWWCVKDGKVTYEWRALLKSGFTLDWGAKLKAYSTGTASFADVQMPLTLTATDPQLAVLVKAIDQVAANDSTKPVISPPPSWVVSKAGLAATALDRPSFAVVAGKRAFSSKTRAIVGAACDCTALKLVEGQSTYCQVAPASVAVCTKAP